MKSLYALIFFFVIMFIVMGQPQFVAFPRPPYYMAAFSWEPVADPSVMGYKVHWGTNTGVYTEHIDVGNTRKVIIGDFVEGAQYYSTVTAYTATGEESQPTPEIAFSYIPEESVDVSIQSSTNLKTWNTTGGFSFAKKASEFFRLKIETQTQASATPIAP
jgi:hypothetical protein